MSFYKQILANILLLCQIGIMTSYPVVDQGEQKQDVLNRDNAKSGVLMETNALQNNANSSNQRNLTLTWICSPHMRVWPGNLTHASLKPFTLFHVMITRH